MSDPKRHGQPLIGFVIVSHGDTAQLSRLIEGLNRHYREPPIAVHHDPAPSASRAAGFPGNVRFVQPAVRTGWAKWSVVEAALRAFAVLYESSEPDWFFLLSASDYPCMAPSRVAAALNEAGVDAFLDVHHLVDAEARSRLTGDLNPQLTQFLSPANRRLKWNHYIGAEVWVPVPRRRADGGYRPGRYTFKLPFRAPDGPFGADYGCFYGDHWFAGNRKTARILLAPDERDRALRRHLRFRAHPDEGYYQTVLCNRPELVVDRNNRRFTEWNGGGAHPMTLTAAQIGPALASGAFFARKFAPGSPLLDLIDQRLTAG